jgi:lysine/ornithine N-monooxygenase
VLLQIFSEPHSQDYYSHSFSNIYFVREEKLVSKQKKNPQVVQQDLVTAIYEYVRQSSHEGRAIAQAVIRWLPTAAVWVQTRV